VTRLLQQFGLPLLGKELLEQAARMRTYVIRAGYAILLFLAAYMFFYDTLRVGNASPMAALGRGRQMLDILVGLQFAGIYLFMPALTCGVIAQEKERASLQLLFLTRLGPWAILFEKLASRMVTMLCFLLLSLPLLAFAYTLGGISPEYLWTGVVLLLLTVFQLGALSLFCSAYCRTTVASFVMSYVLLAVTSFGPALLLVIFVTEHSMRNSAIAQFFTELGLFESEEQFLFPFCTPFHFFETGPTGMGRWGMLPHWASLLVRCLPIIASGVVFLVLARVCLVRRAFAQPRNLLLAFFKRLDSTFQRLNQNRWTKGIILIGDTGSLPDTEPIAWRETTKRSLGRARYLLRLLLAIEFPVLVLCVFLAIVSTDSYEPVGAYLVFFLWALSVLIVAVQAASLIAGERSHQTLDVLCATPLSSKDIIRQKFRGVRRVIVALLIPFGTVFVFQCWWYSVTGGHNYRYYVSRPEFSVPLYGVCSALSAAIYLPMVAWLSLWIGLRTRSQARAITGAVAAIVGWCIGPLLFCIAPIGILLQPSNDSPFGFVLLLSPMMAILLNELDGFRDVFQHGQWLAVVLNFSFYGLALVLFRRSCLNDADRLLGRAVDR
jgi:ABC-type transport system involved in multi-copper enzyme maturation permease subunit